eukprot:c14550_g1_i1.p1 GENE.c14550_g1_i1~~c14550_g1_i1.p1  ORF type:complete len:163 (+),score=25.11 c14550_g1_i1:273-761(+)
MAHMAVNSAFGSRFPVYVKDFELEGDSPGTYALLAHLRAHNPDVDLTFVIGEDNLTGLHTWKSPGVPNAGELLKQHQKFLVVPRPGYPTSDSSKYSSNFRFMGTLGHALVTQELSSTELRNRLLEGRDRIEGLTQPVILAHIIRCNLYSPNSPPAHWLVDGN